jgi:hypothetical protein
MSLTFNIDNPKPLHIAAGTELENEDDFKYPGSWVQSTEKDIKVRTAQAWKAIHNMSRIWKSSMEDRDLKIRFFIATTESIILNGCES